METLFWTASLAAARKHRLVVFAGAGVSTEVPSVMPYSFYDEIAFELKRDPRTLDASFSDLMSEYCTQPNGRRKLIQKLRARFDYIESFPYILESATRFHRELSTVPHLDDIVTTNWDPYFERFCGAIPFVVPQDFVFWDMPGRKVFKIHGSVDSYSSIIATNEDFERCHGEMTKGLIGSNLKMLLATKVVLFVGYSLQDHDFSRIYNLLKEEMKDMLPQAYAVTVSHESAKRFESLGLTSIVTDGTFFIQVLKSHLEAEGLMVADSRFEGLSLALYEVRKQNRILHESFSYKENPEMLHCGSYQDGLMDAFGRMIQRKHTGEYSCPVHVVSLMSEYESIAANKRKAKKYADVAYIEGHVNGLQYLVTEDRDRKLLPLFYVFGYEGDLKTLGQYKRACKNALQLHRAAYTEAIRMTKHLSDNVALRHSPFLY